MPGCLPAPLPHPFLVCPPPSWGLPACRFFWITDSCPATVTAVTDRAPFEVLSLAQPIAAALQI